MHFYDCVRVYACAALVCFFSFGIGLFFFYLVFIICVSGGVLACFFSFFIFCFLSLFVGWNYGGVVKYVGAMVT